MRLVLLLTGVVSLLASPAVGAAKLNGQIQVTKAFINELAKVEKNRADSPRAHYWNEPNGMAPVRPPDIDLTSDVAVILQKDDALVTSPDELKTVRVHAGAMESRVVVTRPKSTIRFRNVDPFDHKLYSPQLSSFRPEQQSNGSFRPIEFPEEGIFEIRCKLFPHFKAFVVVTKATTIVPVKADGTFAVADLEPGNYSLKVFYEGKWIEKRSFKADNREVKLSIDLKSIALHEEAAEDQGNEKEKGASK